MAVWFELPAEDGTLVLFLSAIYSPSQALESQFEHIGQDFFLNAWCSKAHLLFKALPDMLHVVGHKHTTDQFSQFISQITSNQLVPACIIVNDKSKFKIIHKRG